MGFSRQEYWSGLPSPSLEDLSSPGIEPRSPALQADTLPSEPPWKSIEAGKGAWYSHLCKNFPQCVVIHTVKDFGIVNKVDVDVFLEFSCFYFDAVDVGNLILGSTAFSISSLYIQKFSVFVLLKPGLENFEYYFAGV